MPADNEPNAQSTAAIATFFLTVGAIIEDASVTAAATGLDAAAVEALAAAGADIAALTAAAAILSRLGQAA